MGDPQNGGIYGCNRISSSTHFFHAFGTRIDNPGGRWCHALSRSRHVPATFLSRSSSVSDGPQNVQGPHDLCRTRPAGQIRIQHLFLWRVPWDFRDRLTGWCACSAGKWMSTNHFPDPPIGLDFRDAFVWRSANGFRDRLAGWHAPKNQSRKELAGKDRLALCCKMNIKSAAGLLPDRAGGKLSSEKSCVLVAVPKCFSRSTGRTACVEESAARRARGRNRLVQC